MKTLIAYYSLSGTTRAVAAALAKELAADIEEIRCSRYSPSILGFLRAGYDSWRGNLPPIEPFLHAPSRYELVVVGAPIWAFHPATPVRTFLQQEGSQLLSVAFLLTHGGSAAERSFHEMELLAGRAPKGCLVVREKDVKEGKFAAAVSSFARGLAKSIAA